MTTTRNPVKISLSIFGSSTHSDDGNGHRLGKQQVLIKGT